MSLPVCITDYVNRDDILEVLYLMDLDLDIEVVTSAMLEIRGREVDRAIALVRRRWPEARIV